MIDYIYFLIYKAFKLLTILLPRRIEKFFLDATALFLYIVNVKHKKFAKANIDLVYGDTISEVRKRHLVKQTYINLVYNMYEFIENQSLDLNGILKKIKIENEHYILDALKQNRKIILITAHLGNWEYGSSFIPLKYGPTTVVGRLLNNKYLNDELEAARTKKNAQMLSKNEASKGLVKALKENRIVGLVIDQHSNGLEVEFLGNKVIQTDSSSRLASKFDAVIIPVFFLMKDFRIYTAKFYEPIESKDFEGENQIFDLTQKQADVMTQVILENPEQWFWQHKRFKEYDKEIYEKNKY